MKRDNWNVGIADILLSLTLIFGAVETQPATIGTRKNVLFLFADDQRADTICAHGNPNIRTPNLDSLVASGFSFRRNYVLGSNSGAVCIPSRAMLMSGKIWSRVDNNLLNAKLLPELLRDHGYVTFATGKWHNGEASWLKAFERGKAVMFGGMSNHEKVPIKDLGPEGQLSAERIGEKFSSELFADAAIDFIKGYRGDRPFFVYVAFTAPHDPRMPPYQYREMYYRQPPPLPANFQAQLPFDNGMMAGGRDENLAPWPRTPGVIRDQLCEYYGLITHLDEQVGRILNALRESGHAGDTIIVYAADNGLAIGSHGLLGKQNLYEHSVRVPLVMVGPGIPKGKETWALTALIDVYPTLCDLLGIPVPTDIDGTSLRPLFENAVKRVREHVFLPFMDIQRAVMDDTWKLICYPKISHFELFNLTTDPHERNNLVDNPSYAPQFQKLMHLLRTCQINAKDNIELPTNRKPVERVDLTGRPRTPDQWQPEWIVAKYFLDAK